MASTLEIQFEVPDQELANEIGYLILDAIFKELSGPRHGRWYPIPGNIHYDRKTPSNLRAENYHVKFTGAITRNQIKGGAYQASAPGEAPAVRTGRLRQSFYMLVNPLTDGMWKVTIKTNVMYADDLEYGTERIKPRPFADPAVQKVMPQIVEKQTGFLYRKLRAEK